MSTIELGPIKDSIENARTVEELVADDAISSGTLHPELIARPERPLSVRSQRVYLKRHTKEIVGASIAGDLLGFMQTSMWHPSDQIPFTNGKERRELEQFARTPFSDYDSRNALHIGRLLVNLDVDEHIQEQLTDRLLGAAELRAREMGMRAINVSFHSHHPAQAVALQNGYLFTGKAGTIPALPEVTQRLYRKPLD